MKSSFPYGIFEHASIFKPFIITLYINISSHFYFHYILGTVAFLIFTLVCGIMITQKLSAVHRLVIDSGRPIFVWAISMALGWQHFQPLQIVGFILMVLGVLIFNDILIGKILLKSIFRLPLSEVA